MTEWKCKEGCSDCCGPVMFPKELFEKHKHKIRVIYELYEDTHEVMPTTEDSKCVFLDVNYKCTIYDERPPVCQMYGRIPDLQCPHIKMNGNPRSPAKVRQMTREIEHKVDATLEEMRKRVERNKKQWGIKNEHK